MYGNLLFLNVGIPYESTPLARTISSFPGSLIPAKIRVGTQPGTAERRGALETLRNDAQVILRGENSRQDAYVLAITDHDFATWAVDQDGNCFWGHYFSRTLDGLMDAVRDYKYRTEHGK